MISFERYQQIMQEPNPPSFGFDSDGNLIVLHDDIAEGETEVPAPVEEATLVTEESSDDAG